MGGSGGLRGNRGEVGGGGGECDFEEWVGKGIGVGGELIGTEERMRCELRRVRGGVWRRDYRGMVFNSN